MLELMYQSKPSHIYLTTDLANQDHIRPPVGQHISYNSHLGLLTPHFNTTSSELSVRAKHLHVHILSEEHSSPPPPPTLATILLSKLLDRYFSEHLESCRPHQRQSQPSKALKGHEYYQQPYPTALHTPTFTF